MSRRYTTAVAVAAVALAARAYGVPTAELPVFRILPIGDSITEEHQVEAGCYRIYLERMLRDKGIPYDMLGSKKGWLNGRGPADLDMDYEAWSGQVTGFVVPKALAVAKANTCDIALIHLGTNDLLYHREQGLTNAMAGYRELVAGLKEINPKMKIFVAMIPAACRESPLMEQFNTQLKDWAATEKNVFHVEVRPVPGGFLRDRVHTSAAGAEHLARKWFEAMDKEVFNNKEARLAEEKPADIPAAADRELRTWTSKKGTRVTARLAKTVDGRKTVVLNSDSGKLLKIGMQMLSDEDRAYVSGMGED